MGTSVTESIPPHPVLEEYYPVQAARQSFVGELFDGAARYYNHIGRMLDLGSGPMYRRQALQRAGLKRGMRLLDVATGTGLVARGAAEVLGDPRRVVGVDPGRAVLDAGESGVRQASDPDAYRATRGASGQRRGDDVTL